MLLRRVREAGGELMLRVTRPELRSTLRLTALDRVFEVAPC
jgi:anti-anti-sigma regulatory factor